MPNLSFLNIMNLIWIDVALLFILGYTIVRGLMRGFIRSVFDILALGVAIYCAFLWYSAFAVYISTYFKSPVNSAILSFFLIWILTYFIVAFIGNVLHKIFGRGILSPLNVMGGGLIGAAKGLLIIWFFIQLISIFPLPGDVTKPIKNSYTIRILNPILKQIQTAVSPIIPELKKIDLKKIIPVKAQTKSKQKK